jgi:hypothetical protein
MPDGHRLLCNLDFTGLAIVDLNAPLKQRVPVPVAGVSGSFFPVSWSSDGSRLSLVDREGQIALYSFATRRFEVLPSRGFDPSWLRDGRSLLLRRDRGIYEIDLGTRQEREVLAAPVGSTFASLDLSPDERALVMARATKEGDLWMLTMQEETR